MATTLRDLKKSCPICGEPLASSGAYDLHVAQAHQVAAHGSEPAPEPHASPSAPAPVPDRRPALRLPLVAFVMAVVLAVAGVAVVVHRSGHHAASVVASATPPLPPASPEVDKVLAERVVLKFEDLPAGWKAKAGQGGDESPTGSEVNDCIGKADPTKGQNMQSANSPTFVQPPFTQADASVDVDGTIALAKADFAALDAVMACVHDGLAKAAATGGFGNLPRGVTATVGPVEPLPTFPYGDESAARRVTITIQGAGGSIPLSVDVRVVRRQRIVAVLMTLTNGSTLTPDEEQELVGKMAARMP